MLPTRSATLLALALGGCAPAATPPPAPARAGTASSPGTAGTTTAPPSAASPGVDEPSPLTTTATATATPAPARPRRRTACEAPSLEVRSARDGRDDASLARCTFGPTGDEIRAASCGLKDVRRPFELARLDEAVLAFDEATREHVGELAARGAALGRKTRVFGLAGDSMTASPFFLHGFTAVEGEPVVLDPEVAHALQSSRAPEGDEPPGLGTRAPGSQGTIVDVYRGFNAQFGVDSFGARRAAKVGAVSQWALSPAGQPLFSPLGSLVERISPAVVVVMYGSNDAGSRFVGLDELEARFRESLGRIVDYLEDHGVVPVLTTIPRHTDDAQRTDCSSDADAMTDHRIAVQTSRLSAATAMLACERHLPLVDLRHALDALVNFGIGADGVHMTSYVRGNAVLDRDGLQCGYNVRSYVTLAMLRELAELLPGPSGAAPARPTPR